MRGALLVGIVIVLLIISLLVMKNMGVETSKGVTETQAKKIIEQAEHTAEAVGEKVHGLQKKLGQSD